MTDLSLLLHAAARGARVQFYWNGEWMNTAMAPLEYPGRAYRIHQDDTDLLWGPLSRQYRDAALYTEYVSDFDQTFDLLGLSVDIEYGNWIDFYKDADEITRGMILLIVATALQSEGL